MHITLEADYAIRIILHLAKSDKRQDANAIANASDVTVRFALKILRKFVANGILKSYKGAQGGYELIKAPSEISLKEVIETVEGEYFISRCLMEGHVCARNAGGMCKVNKAFGEISEIVKDKLSNITIDTLL